VVVLAIGAVGGGSGIAGASAITVVTGNGAPIITVGDHAGGSKHPTAVAFAECMRSHGIPNFPDPTANGGFTKAALRRLGISKSKLQAAQAKCTAYLPSGGGSESIPTKDQKDYLKAAACLRRHGVPNFPDPVFSNGNVSFDIPSTINQHAPKVVRAIQTCQKLIPAGLPDSGRT